MVDQRVHPIADCWPLIAGEDFDRLVEDVRTHGLIDPITLYGGAILDGRNRFRACEVAGVEPQFDYYDGDDPIGFALSKNEARRHLSDGQRAAVATKLANLGPGRPGNPANLPLSGTDPKPVSQSDAAKLMGVSERSVRHAKSVMDHGAPEIVAKVERGEIAVSAAAEIARLPVERQREVATWSPKEIVAEASSLRAARPTAAATVEPTHSRAADVSRAIAARDAAALRTSAAALLELAEEIDPRPAAPAASGLSESTELFALEPVSPLSRAAAPSGKAAEAQIRAEFETDFWPQVPKKVGKAEALKAYLKARKDTSAAIIIDGIMRFAATRVGEDPQFTKAPAAWLNGRRWEDEPETSARPRPRDRAGERVDAMREGMMSFLNGEPLYGK